MVKKLNTTNNKIKALILVIILTCSFSIIPTHAQTNKVIIGGEAFGLKLYCKGVMITKLENFKSDGKTVCPAKEAGLKVNDIIIRANRKKIKSNETLSGIIADSGGAAQKITVLREDEKIRVILKPKINEYGNYCAGIWIKDSCAGLGTVSYYNPDNKTYGALGHGIRDIDSGGLITSDNGEILSANITSVTKSTNNKIGMLNGYFTSNTIGTVSSNDNLGLYGNYRLAPKNKTAEIAEYNEIHAGEAKMYTTVKGTTPKSYRIRIIKVLNTDKNTNKNFIIKVIDSKLLSQTGGIVQGMSGSPIVQDEKFVGTLTHVFINDCTMGYAILAKNMVTN